MQFPNSLQCALMFDRRVEGLEEIVGTFMRVELAQNGSRFNIPDANPGLFYRLFGGDDLMITFEYIDAPANLDVFRASLSSHVTGQLCPDIRERLALSKSHILLNVSHGVMGGIENDPQIAQFMKTIGRPPEGHSLPQFLRRLNVLAMISRMVVDHAMPSAVHWTQSDMLIPGEIFDTYASGPAPAMLNIHPYLFGNAQASPPEVGIQTFGMRHFIGHEVIIEPNILPWHANFETIMALLRVATTQNGYIIPDRDTFGPEDHSLSYRVLHRGPDENGIPTLEMVPLLYREFGFVSADYVPRDNIIDDRSPPLAIMPEDDEQKMQIVNEWREKRSMAEGIGGEFEVRVRNRDYNPPRPAPLSSSTLAGSFGRRIFGRKER